MKLAFFLCLIVAILASRAAGIAAGEAWRLSDPRTFKISTFLAVPFVAVTLALFVVGANNGYFKHFLHSRRAQQIATLRPATSGVA